jgi:hypothetical protein
VEAAQMRDFKLWTDLLAAAWLVWIGSCMTTENARSAFLFKVVPIGLAVVLAMSQAKAIF